MIEELFPNLFLLLKTAGWVLGIGFTLCISIRLLDMLKNGKTTGTTVCLIVGTLIAFLLAINGAHAQIVLIFTPIVVWWIGCFFDSSWRSEDDNEGADCDEESWSEFFAKQAVNIMIARTIDKEIENARNGSNNGPNMHI